MQKQLMTEPVYEVKSCPSGIVLREFVGQIMPTLEAKHEGVVIILLEDLGPGHKHLSNFFAVPVLTNGDSFTIGAVADFERKNWGTEIAWFDVERNIFVTPHKRNAETLVEHLCTAERKRRAAKQKSVSDGPKKEKHKK